MDHIMNPDTSSSSSSSPMKGGDDICDRRLSRAARQIVIQNTLPIFQHYYSLEQQKQKQKQHANAAKTNGAKTNNDDELFKNGMGDDSKTNTNTNTASSSQREIMIQYSNLLTHFMTTNDNGNNNDKKKCVLNPKLDIFWNEEISHTTRISTTRRPNYNAQLLSSGSSSSSGGGGGGTLDMTSRTMTTTTRSKFNPIQLHVCGECGKSFLSRYYLDLHSNQHINININPTTSDNGVCPAKDICSKLSGKNIACYRQALHDEPYYASGGSISGELQTQLQEQEKRHHYHQQQQIKQQIQIQIQRSKTTIGGGGHHHHRSTGSTGGGRLIKEPYYLKKIKHVFQREIDEHPCEEEDMEQSRYLCYEMIHDCFGDNHHHHHNDEDHEDHEVFQKKNRNDMIHALHKSLCDVQTCQLDLHNVVKNYLTTNYHHHHHQQQHYHQQKQHSLYSFHHHHHHYMEPIEPHDIIELQEYYQNDLLATCYGWFGTIVILIVFGLVYGGMYLGWWGDLNEFGIGGYGSSGGGGGGDSRRMQRRTRLQNPRRKKID